MTTKRRLKRYIPNLSELEYDLQCEWGAECSLRLKDLKEFYRHLDEHLSHYINQYQQVPNLTCQWRNCGHVEEIDISSFIRHVQFHGFHTKLKYLGMKTCEHNHPNIPPCQKSIENRNIIPDLPVEFRCSWGDCQFINSHAQLFYEHVNQHAGSDVCRWTGCTHRPDKPSRIREHIRRHTQEKTIACPRCGSLFSCGVKFIEHCQLSTEVSPNFQCDKCAQQFQSKSLLQKHLNKHATKHACPYCTQIFSTPSGVKRHIIYRHTDIKYFQCPDCSLSFKCANSLTVHRRRLHLLPLLDKIGDDDGDEDKQQPTDSNDKKKPQYKYACHLCNRCFSRGKKLTTHLLKIHQLGKAMGCTRLSYTMRRDGFFRVQSELVPVSISSEYALTQQQQQQQTNLPSTSQHLPQTTCASFLINRLLNDREDGNQHPPFSPEFELDNWNDNETENTDRDDDDEDDDDDDDYDNDDDDITDYIDLCSKRAMHTADIL
ncbi:unnamed protein product [Rotaria magnacalcarata]|uniref:C2H2-type domain-containing protein n=1 Tax=Rotaria magnacalcarata TaxID=392030 RepID=A0A816AR98_9BILA|nr:unnamed protein product [Rotaria magnacalcarata]CAF3967746.1 unnamed protein product [Rotaria magnacalcarata]